MINSKDLTWIKITRPKLFNALGISYTATKLIMVNGNAGTGTPVFLGSTSAMRESMRF